MNHKLVVELKKRYPNLTKTEIEICVYISMKLDRKNIAKLRNTSFYTVKSTVYRVRKKMDLPPEVTLDDFIEEEIMSTF
jgi:DNA-binding NarL/FixJ family response regulator